MSLWSCSSAPRLLWDGQREAQQEFLPGCPRRWQGGLQLGERRSILPGELGTLPRCHCEEVPRRSKSHRSRSAF